MDFLGLKLTWVGFMFQGFRLRDKRQCVMTLISFILLNRLYVIKNIKLLTTLLDINNIKKRYHNLEYKCQIDSQGDT